MPAEVGLVMTITELLAHVGDENIQFQMLESDTVSANTKTITFATSPQMAQSVMGATLGVNRTHRGIVVWLPVEKLPDELK